MRCLAAKPIVNGIENELKGKADVVRFNMMSKEGRAIAKRYDVQGFPTMVVIDAEGKVLHRHHGIPNRRAVIEAVLRG